MQKIEPASTNLGNCNTVGPMEGAFDQAMRQFAKATYVAAAVLVGAWLLAQFAAQPQSQADLLTSIQFRFQDRWIAPIFLAACLIRPIALEHPWVPRDKLIFLICACAALFVCTIGHYLIFQGFDLSRDEQMVSFDAAIFRSGHLVSPVPADWREFVGGFNRTFMLDIGQGEAWVSAYLPVNAAIHAALGSFGLIDLASPLMVAAGGYFLWMVAGLLWPQSASTRSVAVLLYFTSSQIILTGMTKFSMSAHLTLNLLWLLLFLKKTRRSHGLACVVGFFATGLHQPIFHPLFILPFLNLLRRRREWRLLLEYVTAYALILGFWFSWPLMLSSMGSGVNPAAVAQVDANFFDRLAGVLKVPDIHGVWLMGSNLVRLITWQHPLLIPLALFAAVVAWRAEPIVRALAFSLLLPIVFFWVLLPWQGHGWGYRYLHPALGSLILLAAIGWHQLERRFAGDLRRPLVWTTAVAAVLLLPMHAVMANRMVLPLAATDREMSTLPAETVILDDKISDDLAINRPDLSNRPVRLLAGGVHSSQVAELCRQGRLIFVDPPATVTVSANQLELKRAVVQANCAAAETNAESLASAYIRR